MIVVVRVSGSAVALKPRIITGRAVNLLEIGEGVSVGSASRCAQLARSFQITARLRAEERARDLYFRLQLSFCCFLSTTWAELRCIRLYYPICSKPPHSSVYVAP